MKKVTIHTAPKRGQERVNIIKPEEDIDRKKDGPVPPTPGQPLDPGDCTPNEGGEKQEQPCPDSGQCAETFTRTEASSWGDSELGGTWTHAGNGTWGVDGDQGSAVQASGGGSVTSDLAGFSDRLTLPVEVLIKQTWPANPLLFDFQLFGPPGNGVFIECAIDNNFPNELILGLFDDDGNGDTGSFVLDSPLDDLSTQTFWVRFLVDADSIRAKVWIDGSSEPGTYDHVVDGLATNLATQIAQVESIEVGLNASVGHSFLIDEIEFVQGLDCGGGGGDCGVFDDFQRTTAAGTGFGTADSGEEWDILSAGNGTQNVTVSGSARLMAVGTSSGSFNTLSSAIIEQCGDDGGVMANFTIAGTAWDSTSPFNQFVSDPDPTFGFAPGTTTDGSPGTGVLAAGVVRESLSVFVGTTTNVILFNSQGDWYISANFPGTTTFQVPPVSLGSAITPGEHFAVRIEVVGEQMRARAWRFTFATDPADSEPDTWQITQTGQWGDTSQLGQVFTSASAAFLSHSVFCTHFESYSFDTGCTDVQDEFGVTYASGVSGNGPSATALLPGTPIASKALRISSTEYRVGLTAKSITEVKVDGLVMPPATWVFEPPRNVVFDNAIDAGAAVWIRYIA